MIADFIQREGGLITLDDLRRYRTVERDPVRGEYRGLTIAGVPPTSGGGIHLIQMLNILAGFDIQAMGFGTPASFHLLAEVMKIAFADRNAATGDPAFIDIPIAQLISKDYAEARRASIDLTRAGQHLAGVVRASSTHTTHVTVADADGNVVAMTQTINSLFGSRVTVPGTGVLLNNTMALFDPHPGHTLSVAPGKRMTSSMAPTIVFRDGEPVLALGLPGGVRIFTSVLQALVNLIDHGMTLQEAVEAPRIWTQGQDLEVEASVPDNCARRPGGTRSPGGLGTRGGRRHERDRHRAGRHIDGRCLLARRWYADRCQRWPGPPGDPLQAGGRPPLTAPQASGQLDSQGRLERIIATRRPHRRPRRTFP